jgi:hypothetical protein
MNETVRATLSALPKEFLEWLESLRHKNPLSGSDACRNANSVFVEIGKNIIVDTILEEREKAINPRAPQMKDADGSEIMMNPISE